MNKRIAASLIAIGVLIIGIVVNIAGAFFGNQMDSASQMMGANQTPDVKVVENGSQTNKIARINIEGPIISSTTSGSNPFNSGGYQHQQMIKKLEAIKEDNSVKGVLLYVNSPGGGVYESAEIHEHLNEIKEAGKTIYVSMGGTAASGGYYVATPADQIFASKETLTGSLGVIIQSINYQELAIEYGVKWNTFTSGEFKDILSPTKEMTDAEREIIQELVNESYDQFVQVIAEGRNMERDRVLELADGRIYSGNQALENGLIDEIGFTDDALNALKEEIGGNPQVIEYRNGVGDLFANLPFAKSFMPNSEIQLVEELINNRQGPTLMYLYE
ncbi:signal peptide peptidase SppA [Halobacillus litoralis]|uniref:signal peptide peptidase SppA n=1 Tax=Halobacillus litoralis TaxID=45668 RepID=UPI001CD77DED|nr:signal peptide peptidase SppA [Halobacillus litoralis]MCA0970257.1 signal peptide peptidase SppA [Halobacillus litoralis]